MFNTISWQAYWTSLAFVLFAYYLAVYLLYFRKSVSLPGHVKANQSTSALHPLTENHNQDTSIPQVGFPNNEINELFTSPQSGTEENMVYMCMDELHAFFEEAKKVKWEKEQIILSLSTLLQKYPTLKGSLYQESISRVIKTDCEHHCSIHFSAEDLVQVWSSE